MPVLDQFPELRPPLGETDALVEADRCLDCSGPYAVAPCVVACPAHVDVPRFVRELADGRPLDAATTIYRENLLGGTCARVCPVEVLCEGACVLRHEGQPPIAVAALQRYATDVARAAKTPLRERAELNGRSVAVIGAGPGGLACAGELAARGFDVVVFDEHAEVGGTRSDGDRAVPAGRRPAPGRARGARVARRSLPARRPHSLARPPRDARRRSRRDLPRSRARRRRRARLSRHRSIGLLALAAVHRGAQARPAHRGRPACDRARRREHCDRRRP